MTDYLVAIIAIADDMNRVQFKQEKKREVVRQMQYAI